MMSKPAQKCFDLSTIEGVRVFGFAVAEAAKHMSGQNIAEAKEFKAASDRIANLVIELGGNKSEKDSALKVEISNFNFRDPRFLGYLENNKILRLFLMDLRYGHFVNKADHRPYFIKRNFDKVPIYQTDHLELLFDLLDITDNLLERAASNSLTAEVPFECVVDRHLMETFFRTSKGKGGGANRNSVDFRREAAIRALSLHRWRNDNKEELLRRYKEGQFKYEPIFDLKNIICELFEKPVDKPEFTVAGLDAPSQKNQIKVVNANREGAVSAVEQAAQKIIKERKKKIDRGAYAIRIANPNRIDMGRPGVELVLRTETGTED